MGREIHIVRNKVRASIGVMISREMEDVASCSSFFFFLMNNLTATAMGCNRPHGPMTFGPFQTVYNLKFFVQLLSRILWLEE